MCAQPPPHCHYEYSAETAADGCPLHPCGVLACPDAQQQPDAHRRLFDYDTAPTAATSGGVLFDLVVRTLDYDLYMAADDVIQQMKVSAEKQAQAAEVIGAALPPLPAASPKPIIQLVKVTAEDHEVVARKAARPLLTLAGGDFVTLQATAASNTSAAGYVDAGAWCEDLTVTGSGPKGGVVVSDMWADGDVFPDDSVVGTYRVRFHCMLASGGHAHPLTRTIKVVDTLCPVCTVRQSQLAQVEASFPYTDPGVDCLDSMGHVDVVVANEVNVEQVGTYTVTYRAKDAAGNWNDGAACTNPGGATHYVRTVTVVDSLKPHIDLQYKGAPVEVEGALMAVHDGTARRRLETASAPTRPIRLPRALAEEVGAASAMPALLTVAGAALALLGIRRARGGGAAEGPAL